MARKMILQNVRGSYVFLKQPHSSEGYEPKYKLTALIKKDDPQIDKLKNLIKSEMVDYFGDHKNKK